MLGSRLVFNLLEDAVIGQKFLFDQRPTPEILGVEKGLDRRKL